MPLVLTQNEVSLSEHEYADVVGEVYEYPARYRNLVKPGEQFVYYRGKRRSCGAIRMPEYCGAGVVGAISKIGDLYSCTITNFSPFEEPVAFKNANRYLEPGANRPVPGSHFQPGVRRLAQKPFDEICRAGRPLSTDDRLYANSASAIEADKLAMTLALAEAHRRFPGATIDRMPHNNPGFDIQIRFGDTAVRYIEVKGTRAAEARFFISAGEVAFAEAHAGNHSIWIFHSMDLDAGTSQFTEHDGPLSASAFELQAIQYLGRVSCSTDRPSPTVSFDSSLNFTASEA